MGSGKSNDFHLNVSLLNTIEMTKNKQILRLGLMLQPTKKNLCKLIIFLFEYSINQN